MSKKSILGGLRIKQIGSASRNDFIKSLAKTFISLFDDLGIDEIHGVNIYLQAKRKGQKVAVTTSNGFILDTLEIESSKGIGDWLSAGMSSITIADINAAKSEGRDIEDYIGLRHLNDIKHKRPDLFEVAKQKFIDNKAMRSKRKQSAKEAELRIENADKDRLIKRDNQLREKERETLLADKIKQRITNEFHPRNPPVISISKLKTKPGMSIYIHDMLMPSTDFVFKVMLRDYSDKKGQFKTLRIYAQNGLRILTKEDGFINNSQADALEQGSEVEHESAFSTVLDEAANALAQESEGEANMGTKTDSQPIVKRNTHLTGTSLRKQLISNIAMMDLLKDNKSGTIVSVNEIKTRAYMEKFVPKASLSETAYLIRVGCVNENGVTFNIFYTDKLEIIDTNQAV